MLHWHYWYHWRYCHSWFLATYCLPHCYMVIAHVTMAAIVTIVTFVTHYVISGEVTLPLLPLSSLFNTLFVGLIIDGITLITTRRHYDTGYWFGDVTPLHCLFIAIISFVVVNVWLDRDYHIIVSLRPLPLLPLLPFTRHAGYSRGHWFIVRRLVQCLHIVTTTRHWLHR